MIQLSEYFLKVENLRANVKVKLDLLNYVTKADFKKRSSC